MKMVAAHLSALKETGAAATVMPCGDCDLSPVGAFSFRTRIIGASIVQV